MVAHWRRQSQPEYVSGIAGEDVSGPGPDGNARGRRRVPDPGHGAGGEVAARLDLDAPAQVEGRVLQGGPADGPARAPRCRGSFRGFKGAVGAHDRRRARSVFSATSVRAGRYAASLRALLVALATTSEMALSIAFGTEKSFRMGPSTCCSALFSNTRTSTDCQKCASSLPVLLGRAAGPRLSRHQEGRALRGATMQPTPW